MELGDATAIVFSAPAWAALLARGVLGEALAPFDVAAILLSLTGVLLVARPAFVFGEADDADDQAAVGALRLLASAVALLGSFGAAGVTVVVRLLGTRHGGVHPAMIAHA